jgi:integrase
MYGGRGGRRARALLLPDFWIHDLRHTYATIRLLKGLNLGDVSYQSVHFNINIKNDVYTFWMRGHSNNEVGEIDNPRQDLQITAEGRIKDAD